MKCLDRKGEKFVNKYNIRPRKIFPGSQTIDLKNMGR